MEYISEDNGLDLSQVRDRMRHVKERFHQKIVSCNDIIFESHDTLSFRDFEVVRQIHNNGSRETIWLKSLRNTHIYGSLDREQSIKIYVVSGKIITSEGTISENSTIKLQGTSDYMVNINKDSIITFYLKNVTMQDLLFNKLR